LEQILPTYHDPLFSIVILVFIGFLIAIGTYLWSIYKTKNDQLALVSFLEKFESKECIIDENTTPYSPSMLTPLSLLAKAFDKNGEYHKAISIYLYLIKNSSEEPTKYEIMGYLGQTYIQAGFLERAQSIYLAILAQKPRNKQSLYALGIVYEAMHDYKKAKETLVPLELLGEDVKSLKHFWKFLEATSNKGIDNDSKVELFLDILANEPLAFRFVFGQLLALDITKAWSIYEPSRAKEILDILWRIPYAQIDKELLASDRLLGSLYFAKGHQVTAPKEECGIFSIDLLVHARLGGGESGDLYFEYLCGKCKRSFPVPFGRCPNCMSIYTMKVEEQIGKRSSQTDHSLL